MDHRPSCSVSQVASVATSLVLCLCVSGSILWGLEPPKETRLDEFALGPHTSSVRIKIKGQSIHCDTVSDADACLSAVSPDRSVAVWLGNSQVHGVNQFLEGQWNAPPRLYEEFKPLGLDFLTFSQPNASLEEHYTLYEWLRDRASIKLLIIGLCFDDTREQGLREGIAKALDDKVVRTRLGTRKVGAQILQRNQRTKNTGDLEGVRGTIQERAEQSINHWLADHLALWRMRPKLRGQLYSKLYILRNSIFGITATTKRRKIPGYYRSNLLAFEELLTSARNSGVQVIAYIVPIRNDQEIPYYPQEYADFKTQTRNLAIKSGAHWANLEDLVPAKYWGEKASTEISGGKTEVDFMHFQSAGHKLLAEALKRLASEFLGNTK